MTPGPIDIVPYRPEFAADFARLNRVWLERYFTVEPVDELYLGNPEGLIITPGGAIFFALQDGVPVGTCAAIPRGPQRFELAKLCVSPEAQGAGLGRALVLAVIEFARARGARELTLVSDSILQSAIRLYERVGFQHRPFREPPPYADADVYMELTLTP